MMTLRERVRLQGLRQAIHITLADWWAGFFQFRYRCRRCDDINTAKWFCSTCFYEVLDERDTQIVELCDQVNSADVTANQLRAQVEKLRSALLLLRNGDCWCDRYYDPSCGHQDRCVAAREAFESEDCR